MTSVAAPAGTVSYSFDDADRRATMTTPEPTVTYTYDAASRVATLVDTVAGTFGFGYDDDGRRTSTERPNDVDTAAVYNAAGQPTSIVHTDTTTTTDIEAETYTYDAAGNVTSVTDLGAVTVDYTIDALNRLTETDDGTTVTAYTYDAAGNRLSETIGAVTTDYTYNTAGQLTETDDGTTTVTYTYDDAGNTIAAGSTDYTWNWANQLVEVDDGTVVDLAYNGDGDLTEIDSLGLVNDTTAGLPTLVSDTDGDAYLHHGGILAETDTGGTLYTHTDNQNTVDATTNTTRTVTAADYTAYGEETTGPATVHGYTGEPDHTSGLTYLRARHYNPDTGRLLTADTVQPNAPGTQGYNLHTYTANNPTTWTDPTGHAASAQQAFTDGAVAGGLAWHLAVLLLQTSITYEAVVSGIALGPHVGIGLLIGLAFGLLSVGLHCARTDECPEIFGSLDDAVNDLAGAVKEKATESANTLGDLGKHLAKKAKEAFRKGIRNPLPVDPCRLPGLDACDGGDDDSGDIPVFRPGADTPRTTEHIAEAIQDGRPEVLNYASEGSRPGRGFTRNAEECAGRSTTMFCDEYPFQSTLQAGQGASLKLVPAREQRMQAGFLTQFYGRCGLSHGDAFLVAPDASAPATTYDC